MKFFENRVAEKMPYWKTSRKSALTWMDDTRRLMLKWPAGC